jgi:hypothetical protein
MGLIIEEVFCAVKPPPILLKGLRLGGFITPHKPIFLAILRPTTGKRDGTLPLLGQVDMRPAERLSGRSREPIHFTAPLALAINPTTPWDTTTPVPTQPCQMSHEMRVGAPTICGTDDRTTEGKYFNPLIQPLVVYSLGHTAAGMCQHFPSHRHCPATIDAR